MRKVERRNVRLAERYFIKVILTTSAVSSTNLGSILMFGIYCTTATTIPH